MRGESRVHAESIFIPSLWLLKGAINGLPPPPIVFNIPRLIARDVGRAGSVVCAYLLA